MHTSSSFRPILLASFFTLGAALARAGDVGFLEDFAFAGAPGSDRARMIEQLIPGTEDYYFYRALDLQHKNQLGEAEKLLAPWIEKHGRTARVVEIEHRQALLRYPTDPRRALDYLRDRLQLRFDHQREVLGETPSLPSALAATLISRETLAQRALALHRNTTDGFEDRALEWLAARELIVEARRHLLSRLKWPGLTELPRLIIDDLNAKDSGGFGSLAIHGMLTREELDECLRLQPDLLNQVQFINTYLGKLVPPAGTDWRHDGKAREAYLDRLSTFVSRLSPAYNSRRVNVLYHRLVHDRALGTWNRDRFLAYVRLPRVARYMNEKYLALTENRRGVADLSENHEAVTGLPPVGDDEPLVRSYLAHWFLTEDTTKAWEPYLDTNYLRHVFAETRLVNGLGDQEALYAMLPPADLQALKERIDLDFDWTTKTVFQVDDPVALDLDVKNVKTLSVKVFELNMLNYYRENLDEIDTSVDLDGLMPGEEQTFEYAEPPMRRVRRHFELRSLAKPGTYVVEFVGGGKASRALVRKGHLRSLIRTSVAGPVLTVLDERNQKLTDARVWFGGRFYEADAQGAITLPFSTDPSGQPMVLVRGDLASLGSFAHEAESYALQVGVHVERETLLARRKARALVRVSLTLNGDPVTLAVLEDPTLVVTATGRDLVNTVDQVQDFKLFSDRESVYEFEVPANLVRLSFTIRARVASLSQGKKIDLSDSQSFELNGIDGTDKIECLLLTHGNGQYALDLLGKNGEPKRDRAVRCVLKHKDFRDTIEVVLATDANGRIRLGKLDDIEWLQAESPTGVTSRFPLPTEDTAQRGLLHGRTGEPLFIPYLGALASGSADRSQVSLMEVLGDRFLSDRTDRVALEPGYLRVEGLTAGDYLLRLKQLSRQVSIRIEDGPLAQGYVLGRDRQLEATSARPLQITAVGVQSDAIHVTLGGADASTRLHVLATRYLPEYRAFANLDVVPRSYPALIATPANESAYVVGRDIGDEYRYILERQLAKPFPGNLLARPTLLLNPWPLSSTQTDLKEASGFIGVGGGGGRGHGLGGRRNLVSRGKKGNAGGETQPSVNLDFLRDAAFVATNLRADAAGTVIIARSDLGTHQDLHLVAVSKDDLAYREVTLPEAPLATTDLRLTTNLDQKRHFAEKSRVSVVTSELTLPDITTSEVETYDTLRRVWELYVALTADPTLVEFGFVVDWPKLTLEQKRARYSQYACHELDFFLSRKDPEFFATVVKPYLANKHDQTFLDRWLLGGDLQKYLEPWAWEQLNTFERLLLAQRLTGELPKTARSLRDQLDLMPVDRARLDQLFKTALRGRALAATDALGVEELREQAMEDRKRAEGEDKPAAPGAAPPPSQDEAKAKKELAKDKEVANEAVPDLTIDAATIADHNERDDLEKRRTYRQLYRPLDTTQEWAENNYHHLPIESQNATLITPNAFWADYASHDASQPFYSTHVAEASRNFTEMMVVLALLDLPFDAQKTEVSRDGSKVTLKVTRPLLAYHREILAAEPPAEKSPVLVTQSYYREGDRFIQEGGEQRDKPVTGEMLTQTIYGCHVVITNPTSANQKLDVLLQIPRGALPVNGGQATRNLKILIEPYHTWVFDYVFYFPAAGTFAHFPVHVARDEALVAFAEPSELRVVDVPNTVDRTTWDYISQQGTEAEVLTFLRDHNLGHVALARLAWRMRDRTFFLKALDVLTARHAFAPTLWSYALLHDVPPAAREFLKHQDAFVAQCGAALESTLLTIDPVERKTYQQLDYWPLVNARAHQLGKARTILNDRFFQQYQRFLDVCAHRAQLDADLLLSAIGYLLLQDRVDEALTMFAKVDATKLASRLQLDYFDMYLAFSRADVAKARSIAARYASYPVDRWRDLFQSALTQLDEIEGKAPSGEPKPGDAQRTQAELAATEPSFDMRIDADQVTLAYQNLGECRVNYYLMNVELLFSRNPFVSELTGQFGYVRPNLSQALTLDPAKASLALEIPAELRTANVLVEVTAAGQKKARSHFSGALTAQVIESYAQAKVTHAATGKPLAGVYVKVYARMADDSVRFYKDGYTDLRGRFDYGALSTDDIQHVKRFAILFLSPEHGAIVKEAAPPAR